MPSFSNVPTLEENMLRETPWNTTKTATDEPGDVEGEETSFCWLKSWFYGEETENPEI